MSVMQSVSYTSLHPLRDTYLICTYTADLSQEDVDQPWFVTSSESRDQQDARQTLGLRFPPDNRVERADVAAVEQREAHRLVQLGARAPAHPEERGRAVAVRVRACLPPEMLRPLRPVPVLLCL